MKRVLATLIIAGACFGSVSAAQAANGLAGLSAAPTVDASITLVSGGCGPGGFRDRFGYCRPRFARARFCPPYTHPTPYGCRRNY